MQLPVTVFVTNHRAGDFSSVHSVIRVCGIVKYSRWNSVALDINSTESSMENSDNNYTAVPMEQRRPNSDHKEHALEKPFDEEFWVKVSGTLSLIHAVCFDY